MLLFFFESRGFVPVSSDREILVVEDEPEIQWLYQEVLGQAYRLRQFSDFNSFLDYVTTCQTTPLAVIADIKLPDGSFMDYFDTKSANKISGVPILIVSSHHELESFRYCYQKGIADYITKPFQPSELIAKLERAIAAKPTSEKAKGEHFGLGIRINNATLRVTDGTNETEPLTTKEFQILSTILESTNLTAPRTTISTKVWGEANMSAKLLDVHLVSLRRKLTPLNLKIVYTDDKNFILQKSDGSVSRIA